MSYRIPKGIAVLAALAAMLLAPDRAGAQQGFGQNKVQYNQFQWSYYRTPHFDIYFPQGADLIAQFAARHVEEMYLSVSKTVGHKLSARVPMILHNSHAEFEQTNVIRLPLHEGIGGFTEIFKNRIVLPFEGSYVDFHHVLQHEMVHAVMFDMMFGDNAASMVSRQVAQFPLWVSEGLAEYASLGWDLGSEFFMVDATTFGYVAPPTADFGGFLAYKGGQLFFHFVESTYGKGTVTRLIQTLNNVHDLPVAFKKVTKTSLEEAGEIWLRELRFIYWPELGQRKYGKSVARQLTDHGRDQSFYNLQPAISPNGEEIAFFSDRESWEGIFILNIKSEKVTRSVIQGGKGEKHESFHSFKSGIAWSPDGKRLAITSKSQGKDVIHIIDAKKGGVKQEIRPDVQAILSPSWSRDGRYIAFSGMQGGYTDIYVWDLERKSLKRLTADIAHDDKPVFSPSGKWIAFESDRPAPEVPVSSKDPLSGYSKLLKFKDIYRIRPDGKDLQLVCDGPFDEKMPSYGPVDSTLVFVSNRSGIDNLYLYTEPGRPAADSDRRSADSGRRSADSDRRGADSATTAKVRPISNLLTGCFTPSWSWDGKLLAFSLFEQGGWDVFVMKDPASKAMDQELPKTRFIRTLEDTTLKFFRPLNWATLSSYNADSVRADSIAKADSRRKMAKRDSAKKANQAKGEAIGKAIARDSAELMAKVRAEAEKERIARGLPPRPADSLKPRDTVAARDPGAPSAGAKAATTASGPPPPASDSSQRASAGSGSADGAAPADSGGKADAVAADSASREAKADSAKAVPGDDTYASAGGSKSKRRKKKKDNEPSPFLKDSSEWLDPDGNFRKRKYTPVWSLDNANAALGLDTYYGYGGLAYVTLSDLMGDQELAFALNINGSWENTNGAIQYDYLAKKMDFSLSVYHQAQRSSSLRFEGGVQRADSIFLDRQYGFGGTMSYPLSVFTRMEFETRTLFSSRKLQMSKGGKLVDDDSYDPLHINALFPTFRWVHDNSLWGFVGPVNGQRFQAGLTMVPPVLQDRFSYMLFDTDLRKYWEFYKKYTLAVRVSAGLSEPLGEYRNPHQFWVGGEDYTFNAYANPDNIPQTLEEFYFSQFDFPLRGFDYYEFRGDRKFVTNVEFRYPFIREFSVVWPIPLSLRYVMGNVFADYGGAWSRGNPFEQLGLGLGWGMRLNLGIFVLKYTRAWAIEGVGNHKNPQRDYWSLGAEF